MAKEEKERFITLKFRIGSELVTLDRVNIHQPVSVALGRALKDQPGRPVEDWIATVNGNQLDPARKVQDLNLAGGETSKLTLKGGGGGEK